MILGEIAHDFNSWTYLFGIVTPALFLVAALLYAKSDMVNTCFCCLTSHTPLKLYLYNLHSFVPLRLSTIIAFAYVQKQNYDEG